MRAVKSGAILYSIAGKDAVDVNDANNGKPRREQRAFLRWPHQLAASEALTRQTNDTFSESSMNEDYFRHVRRDIEPLLPTSAQRILDVGAGVGATTAWLRSRYPGCHTTGLEGNALIRDELARNVDEAVVVDLNGPIPDIGAPDLVLCLDVLEHLTQPLEVLRRVTSTMADGGTVIVSLPNIAHASVSLPLLLRARFDYQDAGVLDRTHLRFFDRRATVTLMNQAGFIVRRGIRSGFQGPRARLIDAVTCRTLRDHLTKQFVVAGSRQSDVRQGKVEWLID